MEIKEILIVLLAFLSILSFFGILLLFLRIERLISHKVQQVYHEHQRSIESDMGRVNEMMRNIKGIVDDARNVSFNQERTMENEVRHVNELIMNMGRIVEEGSILQKELQKRLQGTTDLNYLNGTGYRGMFFGARHPSFIYEKVMEIERKMKVQLTWGSREMLAITLMELSHYNEDINWTVVENSLRDLLITMTVYKRQYKNQELNDTFSLIFSFHERFCNIPPFCKPIEN